MFAATDRSRAAADLPCVASTPDVNIELRWSTHSSCEAHLRSRSGWCAQVQSLDAANSPLYRSTGVWVLMLVLAAVCCDLASDSATRRGICFPKKLQRDDDKTAARRTTARLSSKQTVANSTSCVRCSSSRQRLPPKPTATIRPALPRTKAQQSSRRCLPSLSARLLSRRSLWLRRVRQSLP
jgi:hypothetical protein